MAWRGAPDADDLLNDPTPSHSDGMLPHDARSMQCTQSMQQP